jgi:hypothetical protein
MAGLPSFVCSPAASRQVAPELIRWMIPFAASPARSLPVTRLTASGLQYVRTSLKICALFFLLLGEASGNAFYT